MKTGVNGGIITHAIDQICRNENNDPIKILLNDIAIAVLSKGEPTDLGEFIEDGQFNDQQLGAIFAYSNSLLVNVMPKMEEKKLRLVSKVPYLGELVLKQYGMRFAAEIREMEKACYSEIKKDN